MNETFITKKFKEHLTSFFKENFNLELTPEKKVSTGVADLAGTWYNEKGEPRDEVVIEVKQSYSDLRSDHGHNFVGTSNYLAVPTELVGEALLYLRDVCKDYSTGVIEITKGLRIRIVKYPTVEYYADNRALRNMIHGGLAPHITQTLEC